MPSSFMDRHGYGDVCVFLALQSVESRHLKLADSIEGPLEATPLMTLQNSKIIASSVIS